MVSHFRFWPLLLVCLSIHAAAPGESWHFTQPQCITEAWHPLTQDESDPYYLLDNYRMSRNAGNQMAFDSSGTLHLTYWSGYFATNPQSPAAVYYQSWTEKNGWTEQDIVDDSTVTDGSDYDGWRMGGRHPNLAIDGDDKVWITWHDHRHCGIGPPCNGINNIEIYCDTKPAGGSFSREDVRLSNTNADHYGDNGYCPRIQAAPDGRMSVLWYDFHVDGWISDIFMATSDDSGVFDTSEPILSQRVTIADERHPVPPQTLKPAFNMPDLVFTPEGQGYAIWSQDFGGSIGTGGAAPIFFAEIPAQPEQVTYTTITPNNDGYWYPPKIKLAPGGDLWVIYTTIDDANRQVALTRRRKGQTQFESPITLTKTDRNQNADMSIDRWGRLHVVWEQSSGYQRSQIHYGLFSEDGQSMIRAQIVTPASGPWAAPCIALDDRDRPHIVFCRGNTDTVGARGDIMFVRAEADDTAAGDWPFYE